jgi:hypothetical protein
LIFINESVEVLFCIDAIQPIRISNDFTLAVVEKILNNLTVDDKFETCFVEIRFYFNYQSAVILFGPAASTSNVVEINHEVRVLMSIGITRGTIIANPSSIIQFIKSACDYADECDRRFVLKHLQWLSKTNHSQLESVIRLLLLPNDDYTGNKNVQLLSILCPFSDYHRITFLRKTF